MRSRKKLVSFSLNNLQKGTLGKKDLCLLIHPFIKCSECICLPGIVLGAGNTKAVRHSPLPHSYNSIQCSEAKLIGFKISSYFFFPFPIEPKGNPILNHLPPPTHSFFYAKLKMAIPYYSHNGRDSVCVWLCVICLLFFLNYEYV